MAKFVKLDNGEYINVDVIKRIKEQVDIYFVYLDSVGNGVLVTKKDVESILKVSEEIDLDNVLDEDNRERCQQMIDELQEAIDEIRH